MGNPALNKYNIFGFIVQTDQQAAPAASGWTWIPFIDEPTFKWTPNAETLDQADRIHHDHLIYSNVQYYSGGVSFYLMPGCVSQLLDWIQARDAHNQGKWATVALWNYDSAGRHFVFASDVKVTRAEFVIEQNSPVRCNLDLVGISNGLGNGPTYAEGLEWDAAITDAEVAPYINRETQFTFDPTGDTKVQSYDIRNCTITIDNQVQAPEDGVRFNNSASPYRLYNEGGIRATGSFARDYVDNDCYNAFYAMYTASDWYANSRYGALAVTLTRGGAAFSLTMNKLAYNDHAPGMRGSRSGVLVETLDFIAMGPRTVTSPAAASADNTPIFLAVA